MMWLLSKLFLFLSLYTSIALATSVTQKTSYAADSLRRETLAKLATLLDREAKSMKSMAAMIHQQERSGGTPSLMEEHEVESAELAAQAGTELLQTAEAASGQLRGSTTNVEASLNLDELDADEVKLIPAAADASVLASRRRRRALSGAMQHAQLIEDGTETRDISFSSPGLLSSPTSELGLTSELTSEEKRLQSLLERR